MSKCIKNIYHGYSFILLRFLYAFLDLVLIVLSDDPRQNQRRGLVDRKLVNVPPLPPPPPPVIFIAGRSKAALLFWFFGDFRCGALLFMVIYVICKYKNR